MRRSHRSTFCAALRAAVLGVAAWVAMPTVHAADVQLRDHPIPVVLDTSGSMGGDIRWLPDALAGLHAGVLDRALALNAAPSLRLYGFTRESTELAEGDAWDIRAALAALKLRGGTEDGLAAIERAVVETDARDTILLLISDELRSAVRAVNEAALLDILRERRIQLHLLSINNPRCDRRWSLAAGESTAVDRAGHIRACERVDWPVEASEQAGASYHRLALGTGGLVWRLDQMQRHWAHALTHWIGALKAGGLATMHAVIHSAGTMRAGEPVTLSVRDVQHKLADRQIESMRWDLDGDGRADAHGDIVAHIFTEPGTYPVAVQLADGTPGSAVWVRDTVEIH